MRAVESTVQWLEVLISIAGTVTRLVKHTTYCGTPNCGLSIAASMPCSEMSLVCRYLELLYYLRAVYGGLCLCWWLRSLDQQYDYDIIVATLFTNSQREFYTKNANARWSIGTIYHISNLFTNGKKIYRQIEWRQVSSYWRRVTGCSRVCNKAVNIGGQVTAGAYKYWL